MPDACEFPRMWRAVIPHVRAGRAFVYELVAHRLPRFSAIVRTLDQLTEPARGLGGVQAIGIGGRALEVIHLPAGEVRTTDIPLRALFIRRQNESPLSCSYQKSHTAHYFTPLFRMDASSGRSFPSFEPGAGIIGQTGNARRREGI